MKRLDIIFSLVLAMSFFALSSSAEQDNLLVNPGFEKAEPMGWATYGDSVYDTETYKSGKQSGKAWVFDYGDGLFEQFVDVIPGKQYKASVYALSKAGDPITDNSKACIQIEWCTKDNVVISDPIKSPLLTGASETWKLLSTPAVVAPSGATKAKVKVIIQAPKKNMAGSCYFDDAKFSASPLM